MQVRRLLRSIPFKSFRRRIIETESINNALRAPHLSPIDQFEPIMLKSESPTVHMHQIPESGLRIMTEESDVPNYITLLFHFAIGSRIEEPETQGYTKWLSSSIFNSLSQFPLVFMNSSVSETRDSMTVKAVCPSYQVEEFVTVLAQAMGPKALDPRVLELIEPIMESEFNVSELFIQNSFAESNLKNPVHGNPENWTTDRIYDFQDKCQDLHARFLNTDNFLVAASGIFNSQLFCDLINEKFNYLKPAQSDLSKASRIIGDDKPVFRSGSGFANFKKALEVESFKDTLNMMQVQLVVGWEGYSHNHENRALGYLVEEIIGNSYQFSAGGPGRNNMSRTHRMIARFPHFESLECTNTRFIDCGAMGLKTVINLDKEDKNPNIYHNKIFQAHQVIIQEVAKIRDSLTPKELNQAKLILTKKLLLKIQKQFDRIDENVLFYVNSPEFLENSISGFEKLERNNILQLTEEIRNVSLAQMREEFMRIVQSELTNIQFGHMQIPLRNYF